MPGCQIFYIKGHTNTKNKIYSELTHFLQGGAKSIFTPGGCFNILQDVVSISVLKYELHSGAQHYFFFVQ
jgi:hypothetical protein